MKYIFITGLGRSGTSFITDLLAKEKDAQVVHEVVGSREFWLLSWYLSNTNYAKEYLTLQKEKIESAAKTKWYISSDSYLQNATDEISAVFKPEAVFHLIRHPREVIRSVYTRRNDYDIHLIPKKEEEIRRWLKGGRFEQVCWNWRNAVETLQEKKIPLLKLENIVSDFDYFDEKLIKPFGFQISKSDWEKQKNIKTNKTRSFLFRYLYARVKNKQFQKDNLGPYTEWPEDYKRIFEEYCVPIMDEIGYKK